MRCAAASAVPLSADLLSGEAHDLGPESDEQVTGACSPHVSLVPVFWCAEVDCSTERNKDVRIIFFKDHKYIIMLYTGTLECPLIKNTQTKQTIGLWG